ncbi:bestrophin family ion channel [Vibrio sp. H11]|uniref:bestrophin family ion channel n=1 Tax=Vibrio sp. H11 TaxID=2565928 RepID=UPI001F0DF5A8|nr:bestrophin family ion channel [Vibrio sp. H11]
MITALAAIIVLVESGYSSLFSQVRATPFTLLGISLSIVTTIVSYALFGLDAIGDELEGPFGHDENARPLDALVRIIERDILDTLNVTELPPQKKPVDYILS